MATTYRPTALTFNGTSWRGAKPYDAADIPIPSYMVSPGVDRTVLAQQFAYEWYDQSGRYSMGSNPPFTKGSAGRLLPDFTSDGTPRRILRGFIRRSDYDAADTKSGARLYFMYNPETITRDYVSYLDQGALDPFNTVFQAGNLVAPPSFMDFDFSLLFDRQEEASQDGTHPGVFVDYEYFDLVVRNVVPSYDPNTASLGGAELPDNGVMMVNPRDITVVFSPNITVQGRPKNARVSFLKFTHRMIPTRMQVDLTIRVTYFGPMKDMVEYKQEQTVVEDSVPWNVDTQSPFTQITNERIQENFNFFKEQMVNGDLLTEDQINAAIEAIKSGDLDSISNIQDLVTTDISANTDVNRSIAEHGLKMVQEHPNCKWTADYTKRHRLWDYCDCSAWVWGVFASHPNKLNEKMGGVWSKAVYHDGAPATGSVPATTGMIGDMPGRPVKLLFQTRAKDQATRNKYIMPLLSSLMPGDLLYRKAGVYRDVGHVAIVYSDNPSRGLMQIVHAPGGEGKPPVMAEKFYTDIANDYTDCWRPMLGTPDAPGNRAGGD